MEIPVHTLQLKALACRQQQSHSLLAACAAVCLQHVLSLCAHVSTHRVTRRCASCSRLTQPGAVLGVCVAHHSWARLRGCQAMLRSSCCQAPRSGRTPPCCLQERAAKSVSTAGWPGPGERCCCLSTAAGGATSWLTCIERSPAVQTAREDDNGQSGRTTGAASCNCCGAAHLPSKSLASLRTSRDDTSNTTANNKVLRCMVGALRQKRARSTTGAGTGFKPRKELR